jgi:hypothetical protein
MAGERSVAIEYLSIILRAIERAQDDPAQLRSLVYDVARVSLGKQVVARYHEIGSAGFQQSLLDLEAAITEAEWLWRQEYHLPAPAERTDVKLLSASGRRLADQTAVALFDPRTDAKADDAFLIDGAVVVHDAPLDFYRETGALSEFFQPLEVWKPALSSGRKGDWAVRWPLIGLAIVMGLAVIAYVGVAIYSVLNMRMENSQRPDFSYPDKVFQNASAASMAPNMDASHLSARALLARGDAARPALDIPLPTAYGIYAVSEGKLYELAALPIRVPDSRVAISAMISSPSQATVPNGKLSFILFRRDLIASAPEEVSVRVVARVVREMKFDGARPPTTGRVDDQWAIRSKSYVLGVAPLADNPEMIVIRSKDAQFSFSPGRYALVIKGQGYDFNVDGQLTDTAQCLERTNANGDLLYSECRNLP